MALHPTADFETKCWEKDWRLIADPFYLGRMIARCNYQFRTRTVVVNNAKDIDVVATALDRLVARNIIDQFCIAEQRAAKTAGKVRHRSSQFSRWPLLLNCGTCRRQRIFCKLHSALFERFHALTFTIYRRPEVANRVAIVRGHSPGDLGGRSPRLPSAGERLNQIAPS